MNYDEMFDITPIFATPIFTSTIHIPPPLKRYVNSIPTINNNNNLISSDKFLLNDPAFREVARDVMERLIGVYRIMNYNFSDVYITQSWLNITKPNQKHHPHRHPNSIISGVFYINAPINAGNISFIKTNTSMITPQHNTTGHSLYSTNRYDVTPQEGMLVLFPSGLEHEVMTNLSGMDRVSIAFNSFMKGEFGSLESADHLMLV